MAGPKEWFPGKPWVAAGHEEWEFEDVLTWLAHETASLGYFSRKHDERREGGGIWLRFDGKRLAKSLPQAVKEIGYRLRPGDLEDLKSLENIAGAILRGPPDDVWSLDLYRTRSELQYEWDGIKGRLPEGR